MLDFYWHKNYKMKNKFVNIISKILILFVIIIIAVLAFSIYSNAKDKPNKTSKLETEIEYLDTKITILINYLNGINLQNYRISISKVEEAEGNTNTDSNEKESSKEEEDQEDDESKQGTKITKMEEEQVVSDVNDINWDWMQGETEIFYSVWSTIVLDLYNIGIDSEKIVGFSNTIDEALIGIKDKNKIKTAANLARLYEFLPEFGDKSELEDMKKDVIRTKSYIINAYAYVEENSWDKVQMQVIDAEKYFTGVMNKISKNEDQRKFNINKTYILIEELKNSLSTKDTGIFYIKYKNLLEELNVLF